MFDQDRVNSPKSQLRPRTINSILEARDTFDFFFHEVPHRIPKSRVPNFSVIFLLPTQHLLTASFVDIFRRICTTHLSSTSSLTSSRPTQLKLFSHLLRHPSAPRHISRRHLRRHLLVERNFNCSPTSSRRLANFDKQKAYSLSLPTSLSRHQLAGSGPLVIPISSFPLLAK